MNAGRRYLKVENLKGKVFVTSGLGGMSGAQAKAAVIAGCVGVIAEVTLNERVYWTYVIADQRSRSQKTALAGLVGAVQLESG